MKASELIQEVLETLRFSQFWGTAPGDKTAMAWDRAGSKVDPCSDRAVRWSVEGACINITSDPNSFALIKPYLLAFKPRLGADGTPVTHTQLMTLLHGAYVLAKIEETFSK